MGFLELQGLAKRYGDFTAVADCNLSVAKGEFVCLLGPSGCGKTTTLRMIAGFTAPTTGRIILDGNDITGIPAAIGALASMEQCYLSNNSLESVPPELGECVSLETLWLNGNQLKKIPKEIGNLVALETLDLSDNQLETLPKELANLDLLEQLDIYNNAFTKMPKALAPDGDMEEEGCNIVREEP